MIPTGCVRSVAGSIDPTHAFVEDVARRRTWAKIPGELSEAVSEQMERAETLPSPGAPHVY